MLEWTGRPRLVGLTPRSEENRFMEVDKVKIGVVGLGLVSSAHIKGYSSHPSRT